MKNNLNIEVLFEDENYLILNKPTGILIHPDGKNDEYTVCDFLLSEYPGVKNIGEPLKIKTGEKDADFKLIQRPGIVHRLDRGTSGVMMVVRNQKAFEFFKESFKNREIHKEYHAFVYDNLKEDEFVMNQPIGRSKKDFRQFKCGKNIRGKIRDAETSFRVIKRARDKSVTLVAAQPKTGRTHQIRVHLNHIYKPIVCDNLYAHKRACLLGFGRLALHSAKITFKDMAGKNVSFEAPYPEDFQNAYEKLLLL